MYKSDSAQIDNNFFMAEIFLILSTFPTYYSFSIRRTKFRPNPSFTDKLGFGLGLWDGDYRTTWSPVGPAITAEEAGILEKCDRADDGEDIIDCVRLTMFFKDIDSNIVFISFSDECFLY